MRIGSIDLGEKPLFLAPMEDVTDPSFRFICKQFGADVVYTEFISSDGLIHDARSSIKKLDIYEHERPVGIQLYGHNIDSMVEAAKIAEAANPDLIDINYGCPVRKIAMRGAGSGILNDIPKCVKMTGAIVKTVKLPVTVKTRLGYDENSKNILEIAQRLQDVGIQAITIHGRTRAQLYTGTADWKLIGEVKNSPKIKIPVIGNGDVNDPVQAIQLFDNYGVDGIMIARATYGRPWIFKEIKYYLKYGELMPALTLEEKADLARIHLLKSIEFKGMPRGIFEMRRHLTNYFKNLPNFKETRIKLVSSMDVDELIQIIDGIPLKYSDLITCKCANQQIWTCGYEEIWNCGKETVNNFG